MGVSIEFLDYFRKDFEFRAGLISAKNSKQSPIVRCSTERIHNFRYILLNQHVFNWIHVEVDLPKPLELEGINPLADMQLFEEANLPFPNFIIFDSNGAHYLWHLETPFPFNASGRTFGLYAKVRDSIIGYLKGDPSCPKRNVAVKNPFWWGYSYEAYKSFKKRVERREGKQGKVLDSSERLDCFTKRNSLLLSNQSYRFSDFFMFLEFVNPKRSYVRQTGKTDYHVGNRDCALFNLAGQEFCKKNRSMSYEELVDFMIDYQKKYPDVPRLKVPQLQKIATSVLRNRHYRWVAQRNYGAMELPDVNWGELDEQERKEKISERQQAGGRYSASLRRSGTIEKIRNAARLIKQDGRKLTAETIAQEAGVSERSVRRCIRVRKNRLYWKVKKQKAA